MDAEAAVFYEISLLNTPLHLLSDRILIDLFEFESKALWENRLCNSVKASVTNTDVFGSTVGITPISADALLLF